MRSIQSIRRERPFAGVFGGDEGGARCGEKLQRYAGGRHGGCRMEDFPLYGVHACNWSLPPACCSEARFGEHGGLIIEFSELLKGSSSK